MQTAELSVVCEGLFFKIFQQPADENTNQGFVVALTSPHSGAGVSRITRSIADALGQTADQFSIAVDGRSLIQGDFEPSEENTPQRPDKDLWQLEKTRENWHGTQANLARALERLRRKYRYVLIDCASMKDAPDALRLAPLVDGIVIVVEANRTQKDQILYAERTIDSAKGRIVGHVLNKRTYVIPAWCYRMMEAMGI
jgi:Mrp family chromosome partitioning ATPase